MAMTVPTPTPARERTPQAAAAAAGRRTAGLRGPVPVLVSCLLAGAAFVTDAASAEADLGLVGVVLLTLAVALVLTQAVRAGVGRPQRRTRLAARTGTVASLFVAAFLAGVAVLERTGEATSSAAFAVGVAVMSVVLLVVLPLSLVVVSWGVWRDRRLAGWLRRLPAVLLLVLAGTAVTVALAGGGRELVVQAAAAAVAGAVLTALSAGLTRSAAAELDAG